MVKQRIIPVIFINSFRGSGIGDFGWKLYNELKSLTDIEYMEIMPSWKGFTTLWKYILMKRSKIILNIGFTSYGKSTVRNFLGFFMIKLLAVIRRKVTVILHDSVDTSNLEVSGYKGSRLMTAGGSIATKMLGHHTIVVFSKKFFNILKQKYSFTKVQYFPFPCERNEVTECYNFNGPALIVNLGYVAPYKGLDILPSVKTLLGTAEMVVIGNFHRTLSSTSKGEKFISEFKAKMADSNIPLLGYMSDSVVVKLMKGYKSIAVLPYVSGYNSSYSAIFFVNLGIPVITSNIDLFQEIYENGAGILLVDRNAEKFADAVKKITENQTLVQDLVIKDMEYCNKFSMLSLGKSILESLNSST